MSKLSIINSRFICLSKLYFSFLKKSISLFKSFSNILVFISSIKIIFEYSFNLFISSLLIVSIENLNFLSNSVLLFLFKGIFILLFILNISFDILLLFLFEVFFLFIINFFSKLFLCLLNTVLFEESVFPSLFSIFSFFSANFEFILLNFFSFSAVLIKFFFRFVLLEFNALFFSLLLISCSSFPLK